MKCHFCKEREAGEDMVRFSHYEPSKDNWDCGYEKVIKDPVYKPCCPKCRPEIQPEGLREFALTVIYGAIQDIREYRLAAMKNFLHEKPHEVPAFNMCKTHLAILNLRDTMNFLRRPNAFQVLAEVSVDTMTRRANEVFKAALV